nr:SDR family oxidoreductase [Spirochaetota bacterium]
MQVQENNSREWTGKNIVVTGGSKGIGLSVASSFIRNVGEVWRPQQTES